MACLLTILSLIVACAGIDSVSSLAFTPQLQLPNLFNDGSSTKKGTFTYTHLEGNGQLWQASNNNAKQKVSIVIDPLASQLDFGIPWGYRANKKALSEDATIDIICNASPTHCLLTMGLDDHTHLPTIHKLQERLPKLKYIVAPSCEKKLLGFGLNAEQITVLDHGESCMLFGDGCASVKATEGALVGPPWQKRENGYLLQLNGINNGKEEQEEKKRLSIYYEPHGDVVLTNIKSLQADIMVSPITKQSLPAQVPKEGQFTLVYGGDRTLEIAETLGVEVIVPLGNGALDIEGPLAGLIAASGSMDEFKDMVEQRNVGREDVIRVAKASPGVPLNISL